VVADLGVERQQVGPDHVIDVHVVAGVGPLAVDLERPLAQQALAEDRHHAGLAMGVLAGAIDVRVAQRRVVEAVLAAEAVQVVLEGELGDSVGRDRPGGGGLRCR